MQCLLAELDNTAYFFYCHELQFHKYCRICFFINHTLLLFALQLNYKLTFIQIVIFIVMKINIEKILYPYHFSLLWICIVEVRGLRNVLGIAVTLWSTSL